MRARAPPLPPSATSARTATDRAVPVTYGEPQTLTPTMDTTPRPDAAEPHRARADARRDAAARRAAGAWDFHDEVPPEVAGVLDDVRAAYRRPVPNHVAAGHLRMMLAAAAETPPPSARERWALRARRAGAIGAVKIALTATAAAAATGSGLAAGGHLPDPVQQVVADTVARVGLSIPAPAASVVPRDAGAPGGDAPADAPRSDAPRPGEADEAPGHQREPGEPADPDRPADEPRGRERGRADEAPGHRRDDDAPGRSGDAPGRSDEAPRRAGEPPASRRDDRPDHDRGVDPAGADRASGVRPTTDAVPHGG